MSSDWTTSSLLDHYEIRSGLSKPAKDFGSGFPFLSFKDVFYNYFAPEILGNLVQSTSKEREACSVKRGDVFLTRTSETIHELGMSCVALRDYRDATFNGFCKRLRPKLNSPLVPEYVGYYLRSPKFRQAMLALSTMSTRASLNNEMIGRLTISYPSLNCQMRIGEVLKTLDDRITLLRETNQTLEAIAQALFQSWFVDFDPVRAKSEGRVPEEMDEATAALFPDSFEMSELGEIPRGWLVMSIGEIVNRPKIRKRYVKDQVSRYGNHPVFEQGASLLLGFHNEDPACLASPKQPLFIFGDHTCVTKLSCEPFDVSQNVILLEGIERNSAWTYYAIQGKQLFEEYRRHWMELVVKRTVIASADLCETFANIAVPLHLKMEANTKQMYSLMELRDTLLPRLISGQLRLPDAEAEIEALTA
ncbi:restriction endonuclease subunit S [Herbaspirillum seropedicae]|uniref:restriction endonuclease subunit S n=1 Tax=Herbaspirillum seropedicae TaxID=964 RepID=UPI003D976F4B